MIVLLSRRWSISRVDRFSPIGEFPRVVCSDSEQSLLRIPFAKMKFPASVVLGFASVTFVGGQEPRGTVDYDAALAPPEMWGVVPSVNLRWKDLAFCQPGYGIPCFPPPPAGLSPVFLSSIQRHGSRTPSGGVSDVIEFEGVVDEQLTRKGVSELHAVGESMRRYFDEYLAVEQRRLERLRHPSDPLTCRATVTNTAEDLPPSVYIRSSTFPRTRLSGYAWAGGFDGRGLWGLVPEDVLTSGTGKPVQLPSEVEINGARPFALSATDASAEGVVSSTVFPVHMDPLMQGTASPFIASEVAQWQSRVVDEPVFRRLQERFDHLYEPLRPFLDASAFAKLGTSLGDAFFCEVSAGASWPLELEITRRLRASDRFRALSDDAQEDLLRRFSVVFRSETGQRLVETFGEGHRLAFYLTHTHPGFMHATAGGVLLLLGRLMEAKAAVLSSLTQGEQEKALAGAVKVLTLVGGFDYLLLDKQSRQDFARESEALEKAISQMRQGQLAPREQTKALETALRCLSLLLFTWHDSLIVAFLGLLGNRSDEVTPFASSLQVELLRSSDEAEEPGATAPADGGDPYQGFYVRLMYGGPGRVHRQASMPLCAAATQVALSPRAVAAGKAGLCSLSAFVALAVKQEAAYGGLPRLMCIRAREHPSLRTSRSDLACALAGMTASAGEDSG